MKEKSIEEIIRDEAEIEMQGFEYRASLEEFAKRAYIKGRSAQIEAEKQLASQNEELRKENEELKKQLFEHDNTNGKLINHWKNATAQLQSTIDELELKIHAKKHTITHHEQSDGEWRKIVDEKNKEIERLKGLISKAYSIGFGSTPNNFDYNKFETENNL